MCFLFFFFKQKMAYEMRISYWSSDVCSSDLVRDDADRAPERGHDTRAGSPREARRERIENTGAGGDDDDERSDQEFDAHGANRSGERRVGKECASTSRSWRSPYT